MPDMLSSLVDHMAESVAIYDRDGRCLYANHATARIFGTTLEALVGQILWELFPEAVGNPFHQAFIRVAAGGAPEVFDHYYAPFEMWFANRIERRDDRVHVIARDVTEEIRARRRTEAIARTSAVFTRGGSFAAVMADLLGVLTDVFDATGALRVVTADGRGLERVAHRLRVEIPETALAASRVIAIDDPMCAVAMRELRTTLVVRDHVPRASSAGQPWSMIVVPLIVDGRAIGALFIGRPADEANLTEDDRRLADELSASVALFVSGARRLAESSVLEQRLSTLAEALPALVAYVDRGRRYRYVNAAYEVWFQQPRSNYLGRTIAEVIGADAASAIDPHVTKVLGGEPVNFRTRLAYPTGTRDVAVSYVPIRDADGSVDGYASLVLDVSAEARLAEVVNLRYEEQLRANERLNRLLGVAARLAVAEDVEEVARAVVDGGVDALGASTGAMWLRRADGAHALVRHTGLQPAHAQAFATVTQDEGGPVADCIASGTPIWVRSRAEYASRFPSHEAKHRGASSPPVSFGALPIHVTGELIGCLAFSFEDEPRLSPDERTFLEIVASHASEALRRSRLLAELRDVGGTREAMIQASPAAIMLLDEDGIVHTWNPAAERIFGWTAHEVIGSFLPAIDDAMREGFIANLASVLEGNEIAGIQARRRRRDGSYFDAELYAAPVRRSDGKTHCLSMVMDITERKRVERKRKLVADAAAELARSLAWEDTTTRVAQLAVEELVDWCGIDLLEGDELRRVALARGAAAQGPPVPMRLPHVPERGGASAAIATGQMQIVRDLDDERRTRLARDDEHLRAIRQSPLRAFVSVPMRAGDRVIGAFSVGTATRALDDVDIALAIELANHTMMAIENARLYQQAELARRDAETASHAKDEFLAMLSHELRNPLAPITSALELMRAKHGDSREHAIIERQSRHLTRLVDDLLDVSRITRGKLEVKRTVVAVGSFVERAVEMTRDLVKQKGHVLAVSVDPDLVVDGDATRLAQIVGNLLSNAARYTEPGGTIDVSGGREGDALVLRVRDSGVGIAPDMLPRIFDSFVQAPQTIARTTGGLGLGLTIVKTLVELHGGSVVARSEGLGRGTEMEVRLPLATAPAARPSERIAVARPSTGRRVLIVDDNQDAAMLLAELLDGYGHMVRTAFDGNEALNVAASHQPEIAILDLGLPQMDGFELARRLRATHDERGLRLIALSGYNQASDQARSRDAGFAHHLAKPIDLHVLLRLVDETSR